MKISVHDVAAYIIDKTGPLSAMKLEKLLYYCQSWSLVWDDAPLFRERIEAWASGPVVPALYREHRGKFEVDSWKLGHPSHINLRQKKTIDAVLKFYGDKSAYWLSQLTHAEKPWLEARTGLAPGERGDREITHASMAEYYSSL